VSTIQFMVALALLTAPPDTAAPDNEAELISSAGPALQQVAVQLEILDPREIKYLFGRPEDYPSTLKMLRARYQELADAPRASDALRFPERDLVNELLSFNRAFRQNIDARQSLETSREWELREALQETDRLYKIWDTLRDARCDYYYITLRRQALKRLRELVGNEGYYSGVMPPYVPIWRFQSLD
jgi:hypothetical protein